MSEQQNRLRQSVPPTVTPPPAFPDQETNKKRWWRPWIEPLIVFVAVLVFAFVLHHKLRDEIWAYYTDGEDLRVAAIENKQRMILWEDPHREVFQQESRPRRVGGTIADGALSGNALSQPKTEAAFSADGASMVLTHQNNRVGASGTNTDLFLSRWDGQTWSRPQPINDLNTGSNERGASFSRDGNYLYFCSDREGGLGGYDLYVATKQDNRWTAVKSLGEKVNSVHNEFGPAPSASGDQLFFYSDRNTETDSRDIFVATRLGSTPPTKNRQTNRGRINRGRRSNREARSFSGGQEGLAASPVFGQVHLVGDLNSSADDIEAVQTNQGNYVFFASDRDRTGTSGFKLYLSRVIAGNIEAPQAIDVYVREGNATDPAVRMRGFDLLFSSDTRPGNESPAISESESAPNFQLYRSTTREVIGYTDLSRWELFKELMNKIQWLVLLAIASLICLIYLLEKWRDITSLFHKCLAASAGVHLLLLLFMMFWLITQAIEEGEKKPPVEVAISVDALAQEELAMESEQELAEVMEPTEMLVTKSEPALPDVALEAQQIVDPLVPKALSPPDESFVTDLQQSTRSESIDANQIPTPLDPAPLDPASSPMDWSPSDLPVSAVEMMELPPEPNGKSIEVVDPSMQDFQPDQMAIQQVESFKTDAPQANSQNLDLPIDTDSIVRSEQIPDQQDSAAELVQPTDSLEAEEIPAEVTDGIRPVELPMVAMDLMEMAEMPEQNEIQSTDPYQGDFQSDQAAIQQVQSQKAMITEKINGRGDFQAAAESVVQSPRADEAFTPIQSQVLTDNALEAVTPTPRLGGGIEPAELAFQNIAVLERAEQPNNTSTQPIDTTEDDLQPQEVSLQQIQTQKTRLSPASPSQLDLQAANKSLASIEGIESSDDNDRNTIQPKLGLEALRPTSDVRTGDSLAWLPNSASELPEVETLPTETLEAPSTLDSSVLGKYLKQQRGKLSDEIITQLGGSKGTERAIGLGLDWFTNHQETDGHWEMTKYRGNPEDNIAGASLALLCYYGWGIKHGSFANRTDNTRHAKAVSKALAWLLKQQASDGSLLGSQSNHGMYCHGIATLALCEGYSLTGDPALKTPATKAVAYIVRTQHQAGGWRYRPGEPGDLSVTGWQYLALHSARMANLPVPENVFAKTGKFLDSLSGGTNGGYYGYLGPEKNKPTMTATGMFLRQLDGARPDEPRMRESASVLKSKMLRANTVDFYFDYYATLALYQHQGPIWQEWNENLKEIYLTLQLTTGPDKGSWDTKGGFVNTSGRVISTGLAILSLEVYYRLLPMYGYDREETQPESTMRAR